MKLFMVLICVFMFGCATTKGVMPSENVNTYIAQNANSQGLGKP